MRALQKFAALAAAMIVLLATIQWVRSGHVTFMLTWDELDRLVRATVFGQLEAGVAVAALLVWGPAQSGRSLGIALAAGLAGTALVGLAMFTSNPDLASWAEWLGLFFALALVVTLAGMRRWNMLPLATAALLSALLQVTEVILLAVSM